MSDWYIDEECHLPECGHPRKDHDRYQAACLREDCPCGFFFEPGDE